MSNDAKEIFNYIDSNKDGKISLDDINRICEVIGENFMNDEIRNMMVTIDPAFAGNFDFHTFQLIMDKKVFKEMKQEDLTNAFKVFDKSKTGKINTEDFHRVIESIASENNYLTTEEVQEFVEMADPKKEGSFSYANFIKNLAPEMK